jgi:hypothetical protein
MKRFLLLLCVIVPAASFAQTITDGLMMPKKTICTGVIYTNDQWTNYWEGDLKRKNDNIGTITTRAATWMGAFGINSKVNVIAMLPYIWTKASKGTLHPMEGVQDLSLAVKYNFFKKEFGKSTFKTFGVLGYSRPMTNYTPDFLPLSIGLASQNISYRLSANYAFPMGIYVNASGAYTWRSNVTLDRPAYYTNGQYTSSDEVRMPNVFDFIVNVGYHKSNFEGSLYYLQQNTLGGGDIRRQDMPFVSNRMNASKVGGYVMYFIPGTKGMAVRAGGSYTVAGRNVGQSVSLMSGLLYTIKFSSETVTN